jgi:hypothetical protein
VLLLMGLGGLQSTLMFDVKTTLNYATFEASRKGAVNHARVTPCAKSSVYVSPPLFGGGGSASKDMAAIIRASLDVQDSRFTEGAEPMGGPKRLS